MTHADPPSARMGTPDTCFTRLPLSHICAVLTLTESFLSSHRGAAGCHRLYTVPPGAFSDAAEDICQQSKRWPVERSLIKERLAGGERSDPFFSLNTPTEHFSALSLKKKPFTGGRANTRRLSSIRWLLISNVESDSTAHEAAVLQAQRFPAKSCFKK